MDVMVFVLPRTTFSEGEVVNVVSWLVWREQQGNGGVFARP